MFTVKYIRPHPEQGQANMTYEYADRVEEVFNDDDVKIVRLTRFVTGMSANTNNETNIIMDSRGQTGPSAVFVENMHGKLVQRISTSEPFVPPKEKG